MTYTISVIRTYTDPNEVKTDQAICQALSLDLLGAGNTLTLREMVFAMEEQPTHAALQTIHNLVSDICQDRLIAVISPG